MTPQQIDLVKASFAKVMPIAEQASTLFYGRLFELRPDYRRMFADDITEQRRKLMLTLATIVADLDKLEIIGPMAADLGARHEEYGVTAADYAPVGEALIWTLRQGLGTGFTPAIEEAWTAAYALLSVAMHPGYRRAA
ncbi:globin family protein [Sphingoaurantiacus capsulatus]|uniref:Globin family protein n=1 Tax=Sphingoaurantiacus capsulatus TaxID=1771310 RepID=A0ABV7X4J0_9SPHN